MHDLAFPEFRKRFADLFSVRAEVEDYEYGLIVGVMTNLFFTAEKDKVHWEKTVRAAHYFLDRGALKHTRNVCEAFMRVVDEIPLALNNVMEKQSAAEKTLEPDARIGAFLSLYKTLYEGLMTLIAAPVVVGFSAYYGTKDKVFIPKPDGRINLRAIETMEKWMLFPSNRLKEGLNRHVRNAYSHERFRILDGGRVEMWDEDARGRLTWGPEIWPIEQLEALCHRLYLTCLGVVAALGLFGINYRKLITDRGWIPPGVRPPVLRHAQAKQIVGSYAEYNSLSLTSFEKTDKTLRMGLKTEHRGIDQDQQILVGGDGWGRAYKKPVKYEETLVVGPVLGIVQYAARHVDDVDRFEVSVQNEDGADIGKLGITRAALEQVQGPSKSRIEIDRQYAELDTLGDARMWLRLEGAVVRDTSSRKRRAKRKDTG